MGTNDVRIDVKLNKLLWSSGIRSVPRRVRVRIDRRRNDEEDAKEELYSLVTLAEVPPEGLKGLGTKVIEGDDWVNILFLLQINLRLGQFLLFLYALLFSVALKEIQINQFLVDNIEWTLIMLSKLFL